MGRLAPFLLFFLVLTTIFSLFILYSPNPFKFIPHKHVHDHQKLPRLINSQKEELEDCDLFKGQWIPDLKGSQYTNSSCVTIPNSKNCLRHGRKDRDFLNWRWKPNKCDLPRFDSKAFLEIVRGKTMAFVGDSVARNHMESLLCLLSQEDIPVDAYKDNEDRNRIWHFPAYDFTLKIIWTKFFVAGEERMINGSSSGIYDLHLDRIDNNWGRDLHTLDYIIISNGHWFFRPIHLHIGSNVVGCVYCNEPNITDRGINFAVTMAFRAALSHINQCRKCKGMVTLLRTFSPSHFENGSWDTGGSCNRTAPFRKEKIDFTSREWELRNLQVEEIEKANRRGRQGKRFKVLDITRTMLMRPDGHPGAFWGNKWMKGYNDCVHWCLPGPIDVWNDLLLGVLRTLQ
ncbi:xyloglucan O-acetyltransferase 4 [Mercurialis annua]|uniref:xyloglucan O-acetyltransferase 4 n=1 Tax=Mercurialis annua TaxID=3986 RepID=UPI002160806F|nr:xyloglucan O-acetyltransferase 4 [Mercurialis annua]